MSVMGYCLAPLDAAAIACLAWNDPVFRICAVAGGFAWSLFGTVSSSASCCACHVCVVPCVRAMCVSCYAHAGVVAKTASWGFVAAMMPPDKTGRGFLVSYPVLLFYLFVAWVIAVSNKLIE